MSETTFELRVGAIFSRTEQRLDGRLSAARARAENLQTQDTRRVAFILTEAIEAELLPAVKEALAHYDEAVDRPVLSNDRWQRALVRRIDQAVDSAIRLALALDRAERPWKPLLSAESPRLKSRLGDMAEKHFAARGKARRGRGAGEGLPAAAVRVLIFAAGVAVGAVLMRLL